MKKLFIAIVCVCLCANILLFFPSSAAETVDLTLGGLIEADLVESAGHQYISSNYEDVLDAVEFVNEDGTRTVYTFGNPIKYIDSTGAVKRIDTTLVKERGNVWKNQANFFDVAINEDSEKGVTVSYQDNTLTAVPVPSYTSGKVVSQSQKVEQTTKKAVRFSDSEQDMMYQSTYTGYATYVTLPSGSTSYAMDVTGDIADISVENNTVRFELKNGGQVEYVLNSLSDAPYHWNPSDVQTTVSQSKEGYRVQYAVNETVLSERESLQLTIGATVRYAEDVPLCYGIDVDEDSHYDAEVYSGSPNTNYGSNNKFWVGVYNSAVPSVEPT